MLLKEFKIKFPVTQDFSHIMEPLTFNTGTCDQHLITAAETFALKCLFNQPDCAV